MPKVLAYTPEWLSRNNPGYQLFNNAQPAHNLVQARKTGSTQLGNGSGSNSDYVGPNKTIARRGAEIFTAVGKHIRWADLSMLKENFEEQKATPTKAPKSTGSRTDTQFDKDGPEDGSYRILSIALGEPIRQLSVSPNGDLLAITTAHTVHIALLPDSFHLGQLPNRAIRLKAFAIGPTTHVLSQSQVASILWHPCGVAGNCLVTITVDAVVRLWEFNRDNRWSTDSPTLAIDLKKLVAGFSEDQDFAPGRIRNRAFSLDSLGMEVASACFGGSGSSHESGWSATTLWFAMKGGDVYALCPLLPSHWQPPSTLIPSISTAVVGKTALTQDESQLGSEESQQYNDQFEWIRGIDSQDPTIVERKDKFSPDIEVYSRPTNPGAIPRLQGPFQLFSEDTYEDLELSDIYVVAGRIDAEALTSGDDSDSELDWMDEHGVSAAVVCLTTRSGRVYVCLDLEGVEGQWLPRKKPKRLSEPLKEPYLIVLEGLETLSFSDLLDLEWPTFTLDVQSRYSFFITHSKGVFFFSLDPWVQSLEQELQSSESLGAPFRMNIIKNGPGTLRERMVTFSHEQHLISDTSVATCIVLEISDLGYLLLAPVNGEPKAAILEKPRPEPAVLFEDEVEEESFKSLPDMNTLSLRGPARETYQAPQIFSRGFSSLPEFFDKQVPSRHRKLMKEHVRMSTATLDLMTSAHRVISKETHLLGIAAADLFRRCERLQDELRDQISRANEVAHRTEVIVGEDADQYVGNTTGKGHATLDERLQRVRSRHQELASRHEKLREKFNKAGKEVSEKEKLWFAEVKKTADSVGVETEKQTQKQDDEEEGQESDAETLQRYQDARDLTADLVSRAKKAAEQGSHEQTNGDSMHVIPSDLRKERVAQVMKLLERESALVEAAQSRLNRLAVSSVS
ncbi:MAG: hypothetical protein ALECFALPRED_008466 [Alectoria fallacina]|uniref:Uncharacterized protein n=1 Tax=Alectoria fallacina TaxID=1903189 RepID=A0A8H3PFI9_9LECA|nr:MAG: hypothetical protein ALECFALPRED_008466 [Alectoria fallacina]